MKISSIGTLRDSPPTHPGFNIRLVVLGLLSGFQRLVVPRLAVIVDLDAVDTWVGTHSTCDVEVLLMKLDTHH